jgi:lipoprotein-anchoring transpeptidase ErfK/SrfK
MVRVSGSTSIVSGRFWCVAVLTAVGAIGATSRASATLYYVQDPDSGFYRPVPLAQPHRQKLRQHPSKKDTLEKDAAGKPQGPLIIAVSINKQQLKIYDANGFYAQSPVSSGMPGHSTPMGVFSVIQKHKLHHSNIYSNAPMPYMQRITWSGVALHAGVLPGYPASHGCIRMPTGFAIKMWNWTRMGARVIVSPGELSPASFSHPFLPSLKVAPQPVVAEMPMPDAPVAAKADKGARDGENIELRSSVGHSDAVTPITLREQTHTANAADAKRAVTMSDAPPVNPASSREGRGSVARPDNAASTTIVDVVKTEAVETAKVETVKPDDAKPITADDQPATADKSASIKTDDKSADAKPAADTKPARADAAQGNASAKSGDKPSGPDRDQTKAAGSAAAAAPDADAKKDQSRIIKPDAPKRTGQIAVFISRKDSKIYVRQNFSPLFEAPVTIAASDRPLGTHIFTADVDRADANVLHWSVVSLPVSTRSAMRGDDGARRHKAAVVTDAQPVPMVDNPAEALNRITVPADVMARMSEALTTGGSIIVSDQGINQGETGEGTDFIVALR